jgi:hypothetical protein
VSAWGRSRASHGAPRRARRRSSCLAATWVLAAALAAPSAVAQANPDAPAANAASGPEVMEARAAFQEGIALAKEERWADALQAFDRSDARHPHAITTYNIGYCERQLGHPTRARALFAKALADHQARGGVELPADLVAATQTYLSDADRQIARVVVTIAPAGPVSVDGRPLEPTTGPTNGAGPYPVLLAGTRAAGPAEVPPATVFEVDVDPGVHAFVLSVKERPDVVATETLAPGARIAIELAAPAPIEATEALKPLASQPRVEPRSTDKPNHVPAFIALGMGAAGLVAGTVSGAIALGYKGPVNTACAPAGDPGACSSKRDAGNRAADISTVSFITGGVAVGVGALLFFASGGKPAAAAGASAPQGPTIRPQVGWGTLGLEGRF